MLHEEIYFEITLEGTKAELRRFISFVKSGELDEFFDSAYDYIIYDDDFAAAGDEEKTSIVFSNDDYGIELDSFDPHEFLDVFCKAARELNASGNFYDIDDEEYSFISPAGDPCYANAKTANRFFDDFDEQLMEEEKASQEDDEY